jgi:hypothetical protein
MKKYFQIKVLLHFSYKVIFMLIAILFFGCNESDADRHNELLEQEIAKAKPSEFKELYFIGNYLGKPSIYRFDAKTNKSKLFWNDNEERVIDLLVNEKRNSAYFITKRQQRLKSSQPAIERGKLYRIDFDFKKVTQITQLEDGIQIIPFWMDDDRFALVVNSIDKTIASYINKNTQIYNRFGKLLSDNNEVFDLTKDGYPITRLPGLKYKSPNELFSVIEKNDSVQVIQNTRNSILHTGITNKIIRNIGWAENNKHVVFLLTDKDTDNKNDSNTKFVSTLIIFDLHLKKSVKSYTGAGLKRFVLIGDLLIFDNGVGKDSFIKIFNLNSLQDYQEIKISGGCGLRNIPIP